MKIELNTTVELDKCQAVFAEAESRFGFLKECFTGEDLNTVIQNLAESEPEIAVCMGSLSESMQLNEFIVKHVSSKGEITRTKDRETRRRNATQTTGLSKAKRREIARKAVRTKKAQPSVQVKAKKKFRRAMKQRERLGL